MPPLPTRLYVAHRNNFTVRSCRFCTGTIQALFENEGMMHHINVSVGKLKGILKNLYVPFYILYNFNGLMMTYSKVETCCTNEVHIRLDLLTVIA